MSLHQRIRANEGITPEQHALTLGLIDALPQRDALQPPNHVGEIAELEDVQAPTGAPLTSEDPVRLHPFDHPTPTPTVLAPPVTLTDLPGDIARFHQ